MRPFLLATLLPLLLVTARADLALAQGLQTVDLSVVQRASHAQALQSFRERRYADAYGRFVRLADAGHVPSAQLALLMFSYGTTLFGSDWDATPAQQQRWNALVVNGARQRFAFEDNQRGD